MKTKKIYHLITYSLKDPIIITIEKDETVFLAKWPEYDKVYGVSSSEAEAVAMLKREIESLYEDLKDEPPLITEQEEIKNKLINLIKLKIEDTELTEYLLDKHSNPENLY